MSADTTAAAIETKYLVRTPRSRAHAERAARVMPGGETRSSVYHKPYSVTISHGQGARCWDIDGNEYLDLSNNYTCLVHGHAYPPVVEAAKQAMERGSTWHGKNLHATELAEMLCDRGTGMDQVRFANSGSEAVISALSLARVHTGRKKFVFSRYAYHGHILEPSGSRDMWVDSYLGEFGDAESFERIFSEHGDEIAAVMLEPVLGLGGVVTAPPDFFERVKRAAHRAGALFMYDEATVYRLAVGGAQRLLGVASDISVLGKFVGGGFPCGSFGGRAEIMSTLDPARGKMYLSGTFSGNPVAMAAGVATVRDFTEARIGVLDAQMERLEGFLNAAAAKYGLPFSTRRFRGLMNIYFEKHPPLVNQMRTDHRLCGLFHLACHNNGVLIVPRIVMNTSTAVGDLELHEIMQRLDASMSDLAKAV